MPVRLIESSDIPRLRVLRQELVEAGGLNWWPGGINENWTLAEIQRELEHCIALAYIHKGQVEEYLLIRQASIPNITTEPLLPPDYIGRPAWQLYGGMVARRFNPQQYAKALRDLFEDWFGRVPNILCWGELPYDVIPNRPRRWLDNRFSNHYDYQRGDVCWRIWTWEP